MIERAHALLAWAVSAIARFPRNYRFALGERIERSLYDILESLIRAAYSILTGSSPISTTPTSPSKCGGTNCGCRSVSVCCPRRNSSTRRDCATTSAGRWAAGGRHSRDHAVRADPNFQNLYRAARQAAKGKRFRATAAGFLLRMESECPELEEELQSGLWQPGAYRVFRITDPKMCTICAAPFRDRVVHQALVQVVEPLFERGFVFDSYSCRKCKGTHAALERVAKWVRQYPWVLKLDVEKYFPSIDHELTLALLRRKIGCARTLDLFARVLASWRSNESPLHWYPGDDLFTPAARARGLPIGNLTSQFLSDVLLDYVDHVVKDGNRVRAYARYCDDMVVCGDSPAELWRIAGIIRGALVRLRLRLHPRKTQVSPCVQGVSWVGFRVRPEGVRLLDTSLRRARRRFRAFSRRSLPLEEQQARIAAWRGHGVLGLSPGRLLDVVGLAEATRV